MIYVGALATSLGPDTLSAFLFETDISIAASSDLEIESGFIVSVGCSALGIVLSPYSTRTREVV
jgi:hypothetical protein